MSELLINDKLVIDSCEDVISHLTTLTCLSIDSLDDLNEFVTSTKSTVFFFDDNLKGTSEDDATIAWIDTGYRTTSRDPIFISMLRSNGLFRGHITGTAQFMVNRLATHYEGHFKHNVNRTKLYTNYDRFRSKYTRKVKERSPEEAEERAELRSACNQQALTLKNSLLFDNWDNASSLVEFLNIMASRVKYIVDNDMTDYFIINKANSVIINTGLLDKFGDYIRYIYRYSFGKSMYEPYKLVTRMHDYIDNEFDSGASFIELKPIILRDDSEELPTDMHMYDLSYSSLHHCVLDRVDRYPDEFKGLTDERKADSIKSSLTRALKIYACDKSYIKQTYNPKTNTFTYMAPFFVNNDFDKEPELVICLRNAGGYYAVKTVLVYDEDVKAKIRSSNLYSNLW